MDNHNEEIIKIFGLRPLVVAWLKRYYSTDDLTEAIKKMIEDKYHYSEVY